MSNDTEKHGLNTEPSRRPRGWNLAAYHWKPGFCPNPGGRGKGNVSLKTALLRKIRENPQKLDEVVSVLLDKASNGDVRAINLIGEMTSDERGAPVAAVQVNIGADGNGQFGAADEWSRQELDQILVGPIEGFNDCPGASNGCCGVDRVSH